MSKTDKKPKEQTNKNIVLKTQYSKGKSFFMSKLIRDQMGDKHE